MWQVINGNNVDHLRQFADNTFDSIVTDPPYGIDFLGKSWDANVGALETYAECLRVLKPGGHILAFSAPRTYHYLAVTLEQAGFEIRDQIMWIYSSGFPKSQDVGRSIQRSIGVEQVKLGNPNRRTKKNYDPNTYDHGGLKEEITGDVVCTDPAAKAWEGWGTSLKPAHEPICLARKPLHKNLSIARNCQEWGVGAVNIDAARVPFENEEDRPSGGENGWSRVGFSEQPVERYAEQKKRKSDVEIYLNNKRGPMERARIEAGENIGMFDGGVGYKAIKRAVDPDLDLPAGRFPSNVLGEIEGYQKYFYCPKVSQRERMEFNKHPTVKPIELMKYLIRLITPAGGHVLDPFNGSGSTGCAAVELDYDYTGIELDSDYVEIARKRIQAWHDHTHANTFQELFE
jgi:DNA modification methylase